VKAHKYITLLLLFILTASLAYFVSYGNVTKLQNTSSKQNCLPNNSFEEGSKDFAIGWTYQNDSSTKICRVDSVSCEGNHSYYIWSNTSVINAYSEYFSVISGYYYNVSLSVKTIFPIKEAACGFYFELLARNLTSENIIYTSRLIKETTYWIRQEYNWQIPDGHNYTNARIRFGIILEDNVGTGNGVSAWIDSVVVKTQIRSVICSQPFLLNHENLPATLNFSAQFINGTAKPDLDTNDIIVMLDEQNLVVRSVTYNESTLLFDIITELPVLQEGKYMLKLVYASQESLNFKGVNVYQYTGNFSFIHWTDIHYDPPNIGFEIQLNTTLRMVKKADPDFILMTGDMHSSENNYRRFYAIIGSMDFNIPIFFANGNHEKESLERLDAAVLYMGEKKVQFRNEYPFTFNYGVYQFIGLDSGMFPYSSRGNISNNQYGWLKNELQSIHSEHVVVFYHHPLCFSGKIDFWVNKTIAIKIMNLFSHYGVIATFAGHAHRSNFFMIGTTSYYTTVSGHNDTHWVGRDPFPPSGFRTINVVRNKISEAPITELFSYNTGEFVHNRTKTSVSSEGER
jgi:hypothetical protein